MYQHLQSFIFNTLQVNTSFPILIYPALYPLYLLWAQKRPQKSPKKVKI